MMTPRSPWAGGVLLLGLTVCVGCSGDVPEAHPVESTVTWDDGKPVSSGTLEFRSVDNPNEAMFAEITNGKCNLRSLGGGTSVEGGMVGTFDVTYMPRIEANAKGEQTDGTPIPIPEKVTIKAGNNKVTIKIPRPKKTR